MTDKIDPGKTPELYLVAHNRNVGRCKAQDIVACPPGLIEEAIWRLNLAGEETTWRRVTIAEMYTGHRNIRVYWPKYYDHLGPFNPETKAHMRARNEARRAANGEPSPAVSELDRVEVLLEELLSGAERTHQTLSNLVAGFRMPDDVRTILDNELANIAKEIGYE